jgi:DNA-binding NtrC family response regulator
MMHFLQGQRAARHTTARSVSGAAMATLEEYAWPGNVRELRNAIEFAAIQAALADGDEICREHLPTTLVGTEACQTRKSVSSGEVVWDYRLHLARTELELADRAIRERAIVQKTELASALGYSDRFTLMRRIRKALSGFPALESEYPAVAGLFGKGRAK